MFPLGITHYAIGGALVGLATLLTYWLTGIYGGASSVFSTTWSYVSSHKFFRQEFYLRARFRKLVFSAGLIFGGLAYLLYTGAPFVTHVQWWRLAAGGFLVGIGTRLGRGCTSGHGICGLGALSKDSLWSVLTFMTIAIIVAQTFLYLGVRP